MAVTVGLKSPAGKWIVTDYVTIMVLAALMTLGGAYASFRLIRDDRG